MYKSSNLLYNPAEKYLNEQEALKFMVELLSSEAPRITKRCTQELDFFYNAFRDKGGIIDTKSIKICDVLALSYIKIKYPFLIDFFLKTIHLPLEKIGFRWYFISEKFNGKENYLTDWITEITGRELNELEKSKINELVGLVAHQYLKLNNRNYNVETKERYLQRTSEWITLYNALTLISDNIENQFEKYYDFYLEHKKDASILNKLEDKQLLEYSRFFIDIESSTQEQHIDISKELLRRLEDKKIKIKPAIIEDTYYQEAVYQFAFQILYAVQKDGSKATPSKKLEEIIAIIDNFIKSKNLAIKAKYIFLNSFANNERGSGSEIHLKFTHAFEILMKYFKDKFLELIKVAFEDANERYFDGLEIIYKFEENFFYVLYQSWSGKINEEEIKKIRKAAMRDLISYPEAIKLYWSRYPYNPRWNTIEDLLNSHTFFSTDKNYELYMPLADLIEITKKAKINDQELLNKMLWWEGIIKNESENYKKIFTLQEDSTTLKAIMIKRNFYTPQTAAL